MPEHPAHLLPPRHGRTFPTGATKPLHTVDDDVARYRHLRQRRQRLRRQTHDWQTGHSDIDAVIEFAHAWAPYGGAPDEEIFVRFGMSVDRFVETLWRILESCLFAPPFIDELAEVYQPLHR
ncbi:hypothetical protein AXA44_05675 [Rhodococcus sp. SC4]|uniref:hypothetical protein n=1 Tax=Rhodococcus sp. LB1 TaxID=1807499 RepID=UPI00076A8790|nr:hypothetical protein [Rhodococcus sp. LB1]KXF54716.1 hypothetical protein AXA44_05675 [Rhodococcus sp. SC4]KXX55968.1 hypothetical protein AZG88_16975 [Rhodococcus sp. LB1]